MYCIYIYTQYLLYIYIMHDRTFLSLLGASGPKGPSFRGGYRKIRYRIDWKCPSPSARGFSIMMLSCPRDVLVMNLSCSGHVPFMSQSVLVVT